MAREGLMDDCGYSFEVNEDDWNDGFKAGFLMAVDEFAEKVKKMAYDKDYNVWTKDTMISIWESTIDEIAEQLKGG